MENFGSLFELFAAINIAFVAVDYAKDYTSILGKNVFKLPQFIKSNFDGLMSIFSDRVSLDTISELTINNQSANKEVEKCKRIGEQLKKDITSKKDELIALGENLFVFKHFSSQCLWSFFFCVVALFFTGIQSDNGNEKITASLLIVTAVTLLWFSIGWFFSIKSKSYNLLLAILGFVFVLTIAIILSFAGGLLVEFASCNEQWLIPVFAVIPMLNFFIYFAVSIRKSKNVKRKAKEVYKEFEEKCKNWGEMADSIIGAHKLGQTITKTIPPF